jgi:hypothetical protein
MRKLRFGGKAVACTVIVVLSSLVLCLCTIWLSSSTPLVHTMALTGLSLCGSGFAALMELPDRAPATRHHDHGVHRIISSAVARAAGPHDG